MRFLIPLLFLSFSTSVFADKFSCDVDTHNYDGENGIWIDLSDNVYLIEINYQNLNRLDSMTNIKEDYKIIKNNNEVIVALAVKDAKKYSSTSIKTINFYKQKSFIVSMFANDSGVTINRGYCTRK